LRKEITPDGYGRIEELPYRGVKPVKARVYSTLNSEVLYQKEEEVVAKRAGKKVVAYSSMDLDQVYPILVRTVLVKNKWGQPLYFTGMDREGRIWKRKVGTPKRWYICDSCGHGYSHLKKAGKNLWLCEDCYFNKDFHGEYRDWWLSVFGIWPNERKDRLYYKDMAR
jgi:hypothetical protein